MNYTYNHPNFQKSKKWLEELSYCITSKKITETIDSIRKYTIINNQITSKQFLLIEEIYKNYI